MKPVNYDRLPNPDLIGGLERYVEAGYMPGHFLTAVLENDLTRAVLAADSYNLSLIPNIVLWLREEAPDDCWGSPEKVIAWHQKFWPPKGAN